MSRFVELVDREVLLSRDGMDDCLGEMLRTLQASEGRAEFAFTYTRLKTSPVSEVRSCMDYRVVLSAQLEEQNAAARTWLQVGVPVTTLCPCSRAIADRGAQSQRSVVTVCAEIADRLWIEDLVDLVESEASCQLYGILKRSDEKCVTETAYEQPKFVEDLVRDISISLGRDQRIKSGYRIDVESFASNHNHSVFAAMDRT